MQTLEGLKRRIKTTSSLREIVSSMKTLSAVSVGQYEKSTLALNQYHNCVELALQALLKGRSTPAPKKSVLQQRIIAVVLGSDQGLVGKFNKSIAKYTIDYLKEHNIKRDDITLIVGGKSLSSKFLSLGWDINTLFTMPSSVKAMITVAKKIVIKLNEITVEQQHGDKDYNFSNNSLRVYVFYNAKNEHSVIKPHSFQLLPVDTKYLKKLKERHWPTNNIPQYNMASR